MKALTCLKYLLLIAFGATLFFSCSDNEFDEDSLGTLETTTIDTRNVNDFNDIKADDVSGMAAECTIEICAQITPNTTNTYPDTYRVTLPGGAIITIQNGIVTLPDGSTEPLVNNEFCADISVPFGGSLTAELAFKGFGAVVTTGTWPNGTSCEIFSAGVGTTNGTFLIEDVTLDCSPPCINPTECTIEVCAVITPNTTNSYPDTYRVTLPGGAIITIQNGIVTLPDGSTEPLVNNEFCADINVPFGGLLTAELAFKGFGAVVTTGIWPDSTSCEIFSAGVGTTGGTFLIEDVTLECDAPCI